MEKAGERRVRFTWTTGAAKFSVVFIIDPGPFLKHLPAPATPKERPEPAGLLMFGIVGGGSVFTKSVYPGFWFDTYMGTDLERLTDVLRKDGNSGHKLDINGFFADFVAGIPTNLAHVRPIQWHDLPWKPDVEDADKTYFLRYRLNQLPFRVTAKNLEKTALLAGELAEAICAELNISTCWTADPAQAKPLTAPPAPMPI
ncbi:hypothetical protein CVV68_04740 [Arthrobacter livingstonensis]|uniref:Uncharacterized protein n=1 Tax=Arthrobacter livingstonensis TaxID=670078 RepID=A0A2V5LEM8_9MICC|nr:DUF6037 family protein [Arthrobacter livingstonensis]PYI69094.1 hypothetical protein CVV68_04740 [Arthrobacter livingstonensis]